MRVGSARSHLLCKKEGRALAKRSVPDLVKGILSEFLAEHDYELWDVRFGKEAKEWYLNVYVDRKQAEDPALQEYMSADDCEAVSRYLSDRLDALEGEDQITQKYYLVVSSPGMDRALLREEHYRRYIGELADLRLYQARDGLKRFTARILSVGDGAVTVRIVKDPLASSGGEDPEDGAEWTLELKEIARANLTIII